MGKLIRNGIEYGGGNGTGIFEVTQAEYDALVQAGTLVHNALYVITDAPNLNATAQDISYDGSTTTIKDKIDSTNTTVSIGNYGDDVILAKSGNTVQITFQPFTSLPIGGYTTLGYLPVGYRPIVTTTNDMRDSSGRRMRIRLDLNGGINVYNYDSAISSNNNTYNTFSFITA